MKTSLFLWTSVALFVSTATAFQISRAPLVRTDPALSMATTDKKKTKKSRSTGNPIGNFLQQITNNFEPFHGHGSLENDLEEQWQAQQALVAKRRSQHLDKDHLKAKYKNPSNVKFDGRVGDSSTSELGKNLSP